MDNKSLKINDLKINGKYDESLLNDLKNGEFNSLYRLPVEKRNEKDYMEPILYAVKNEFDTFVVYRYYAYNLQNDVVLASEIIKREPELIMDTPVSNNKDFIIDNVKENPRIIRYMSSNLKGDAGFINDVSKIDSKDIKYEIANDIEVSFTLNSNPDLRDDKDFISMVIDKDVSLIKFASDELKNDGEFLKEQSSKNEKVIDYVVDNIDEFGLEGIKGVRESSKDFTVRDCMDIIDEMSEGSDDDRYSKVKAKVQECGIDDIHTVRWITAMVAQKDDVSEETVKKVLNYSILTMEKTKRNLTKEGEMDINLQGMQELITPTILNRLNDKLKMQGVEISDELQEKLDSYKEFYETYQEQFNEQRREKNNPKTSLEDVKDAITEVTISEVNQHTIETKEGVNLDNKEKVAHEAAKEI